MVLDDDYHKSRFLGIFKYYNFFADSFSQLLNGFGMQTSPLLLNVILPVGISFYTFHGLSYVIDIYLKRIKPEYNFVDYSLFVSYFPLLVAVLLKERPIYCLR